VDRGLIAEQFAPFSKKFSELGWDPQEFKFLGRPVDGIQFQDDEVIIVEFKTGAAQMTSRQRNIKKLITEGKVRFEEMRF
jgi:predicted Holliday junction resolvase-like endonuclease